MDLLISGISLVIGRKDSRHIIIASSIILLLLLLAVESVRNEEIAFIGGSIIFAALGSFLAGINLSLAYTYMSLQKENIMRSRTLGKMNLLRSGIAVGGSVCGIAILSVILGFLGFSTMLSSLSYQGQEVGYIGLIILLIATYTLAQRVARPNLC